MSTEIPRCRAVGCGLSRGHNRRTPGFSNVLDFGSLKYIVGSDALVEAVGEESNTFTSYNLQQWSSAGSEVGGKDGQKKRWR